MVEVQNWTFSRFLARARATLCGDSRGRGSKTALLTISASRARPSAEIRVVEVQKGLFSISASRARPSAEIRVVEVQNWTFLRFLARARATLCGDSRGRGSKTEDLLRFLQAARDPLRGSCVSKRSRCGAVRICCSRNGLWKLSRGSRACFRNPAVAGSIPRWSAAAPA